MFAAIAGKMQTVGLLLDAGADVRVKGSNGWNAIMVAAAKGHTSLVRKLIAAGADVNTTDIYLWTPLMRAVYENEIEVVKILVKHDSIDLSHRDEHGASALHHAVTNGNENIVKLLMSAGADPNLKDFSGRTPVMYSADESQVKIAKSLTKPN